MYKLLLPSLLPSLQISHKGSNPEHFSQLLLKLMGAFPAKKLSEMFRDFRIRFE